MAPRVFVVQPIPEVALDILRQAAEVEVYPYQDRQITPDELASAARRSDYIFAMHETTITRDVILANPGLKGIGIGGRYAETVDLAACDEMGVPLLVSHRPHRSTPNLVSKTTADLTVAMLLGLAYRLVEADDYTRAGGFRQEQTMALMGIGCPGKTVGLIGLGKVARFMVPRLQAFEMRVLYTKRTRLCATDELGLRIEWMDGKDDILQNCDFVCLEVDYNASTHLLIGERELSLMKPTAYLVNTGRGRLVDETALIKALQDGTIAGAALDVFWNEPPVSHDPFVPLALRKLDNVILAPHNGGATWDSRGAQTSAIARNIVAHIRGEYVAPPE
jgi:glyoxylate reductase